MDIRHIKVDKNQQIKKFKKKYPHYVFVCFSLEQSAQIRLVLPERLTFVSNRSFV